MKLFLHWLRWDLRRFRLMLAVWTLLVVGYAAFLGWLHYHILTIDPDWMDWSAPVAKWLGVTEVLMLFYLFSTDPAGGTDPFWKTRPPSGFAVAGSKLVLVLALGFFVVLPLVAWQVMNASSVLPRGMSRTVEDSSWTQWLWFGQAMLVSAMALTAAVAGRPAHQLAALVAGVGLALLPMVPLLIFASLNEFEHGVHFLLESVTGHAMPWLGLAAGIGCFLLARHRRTPARWMSGAFAAVPTALMLIAGALPESKNIKEREPGFPAMETALAERIKIGEVLETAYGARLHDNWSIGGSGEPLVATAGLKLAVTGLPPGARTTTRWREMRLVGPDGRVVRANTDPMRLVSGRGSPSNESEVLVVEEAVFRADELRALSLQLCRMEGTIRLMLESPRSAALPLRQGAALETPNGRYHLAREDFTGGLWNGLMVEVPHDAWHPDDVFLEQLATGQKSAVGISRGRARTGFLMQVTRFQSELSLWQHLPALSAARLQRALSRGLPVDGWQLRFQWYEPQGAVEVPFACAFVVPRQPGDRRLVADLLAQLILPAEANADQVKQVLGYALTLANDAAKTAGDAAKARETMARLLAGVPARHLSAMLELAGKKAAKAAFSGHGWDAALADRIAALIPPGEIAALRTKPILWEYLQDALVAHNLIAREPPKSVVAGGRTDAQLLEAWQRSTAGNQLDFLALEEAAGRGLPWVIPVAVELMDLLAYSRESEEVRKIISRISDCPDDYRKGRFWLRKNLAQLKWDPARRRWVVPD